MRTMRTLILLLFTGSSLVAATQFYESTAELMEQHPLVLVDKAYAAGKLSEREWLNLRVLALFDQERLEPQYRTVLPEDQVLKCATDVINDALAREKELDPHVRQLLRDATIERLYDETWDTPDGHYRFYYYTSGTESINMYDGDSNGVPDYLDAMAEEFGWSWQVEFDSLGWNTPRLGSNGKVDVYFEQLAAGILGWASEIPGGNAVIHMRNSYSGFNWGTVQSTVAHELHHTSQFTYAIAASWYLECTSMWAEEQVYDSVNDYIGYINSFYSKPWASLGYFENGGLYQYGSCVWNFFIHENFGPSAVQDIWALYQGSAYNSFETYFSSQGSSRTAEYVEFMTWNYFTGYRHDGTYEGGQYDEGGSWPTVTSQANHSSFPVLDAGVDPNRYPDAMGTNFVRFVNNGTQEGYLLVSFDGATQTNREWSVRVIERGPSFSQAVDLPADPNDDGFVLVDNWNDVSEVVLVPNITSTTGSNAPYTYSAEIVSGAVFLMEVIAQDDISGNGNGQIENNETASVVVTIANYGPQLDNVILTLSTDNPDITIGNAGAVVGAFGPGETASNAGTPFTFTVSSTAEAQSVMFNLDVSDGGTFISELQFGVTIGYLGLLVVDDDNGGDSEQAVVDALAALERPFELRSTGNSTIPELGLDQREVVIWNIGDGPMFSMEEKTAIESYLAAGKSLFVNGNLIASGLNNDPFLANTLHADFVTTTNLSWLKGRDGDFIGGSADNQIWVTSTSGSGNDQVDPDGDPHTQIAFLYNNQPTAGLIRHQNVGGKLVFETFSFHNINPTTAIFMEPVEVLANILLWLEDETLPPGDFALLTPGDGSTIELEGLDATVDFTWEPSDAGVNYSLVLDADADFMGPYLAEFPVGTGTSLILTAEEILEQVGEDQETIAGFWGVYADNGSRVTTSTGMHGITLNVTIPNLPPPAVSLVSPPDNSSFILYTSEETVIFDWTDSEDPDGDPVTYTLNLSLDGGLNDPFMTLTGLEVSTATVNLAEIFTVAGVSTVYWGVSATDGADGTPSAVRSFSVAANQAPGAFVLTGPVDGATIVFQVGGSVAFDWEESTDTEGDEVTYSLVFWRDGDMPPYEAVSAGTGTTVSVSMAELFSGMDEGTTRPAHWYVLATDGYLETQSGINDLTLDYPVQTITQNLQILAQRLNLISLNVLPADPAIATIMSSMESLLLAKDDDGHFFVPDYGINTIGAMNPVKGYQIFILGSTAENLAVSGNPVNLGVELVLLPFRLNMIANLLQQPAPVAEVFGAVAGNILLVKDDDGRFWVPSFGINTMGDMLPGKGYQVFLSSAVPVTFSYAGLAKDLPLAAPPSIPEPNHFIPVETGDVELVLVTPHRDLVDPGDEFGIFSGGYLAGSAVYSGEQWTAIPLWNAVEIPEFDLFLPGHRPGATLSLEIYRNRDQSIEEGRIETNNQHPGLTQIRLVDFVVPIPSSIALGQNYPNPFNPSTEIEFSLPVESFVDLTIYDLRGGRIKNLVSGDLEAGVHRATWIGMDESGIPVASGVYLYRLQTPEGTLTRKLLLIR